MERAVFLSQREFLERSGDQSPVVKNGFPPSDLALAPAQMRAATLGIRPLGEGSLGEKSPLGSTTMGMGAPLGKEPQGNMGNSSNSNTTKNASDVHQTGFSTTTFRHTPLSSGPSTVTSAGTALHPSTTLGADLTPGSDHKTPTLGKQQCRPKQHIGFVKVHKAASTSMHILFYRYACMCVGGSVQVCLRARARGKLREDCKFSCAQTRVGYHRCAANAVACVCVARRTLFVSSVRQKIDHFDSMATKTKRARQTNFSSDRRERKSFSSCEWA